MNSPDVLDKVAVNVRVPKVYVNAIDKLAGELGWTRSQVIVEVIAGFVAEDCEDAIAVVRVRKKVKTWLAGVRSLTQVLSAETEGSP